MIKAGDKVVIEEGPFDVKGKTGTVVRVASRVKASGSNGSFVVFIPGRYNSVMASRVRKVGGNPELTAAEWQKQEAIRVARNKVHYEQQGLDRMEKQTVLGNCVATDGARRRQAARLQEAKNKLDALEKGARTMNPVRKYKSKRRKARKKYSRSRRRNSGYFKWKRGPNTKGGRPPIFTVPAKRTAVGAWRNLGGHWVKERKER